MTRRSLLSLGASVGLLAIGSLSLSLAAWAVTAPHSDWRIAGPFGGTATTIALDPQNSSVVLAGGMNSLLFRSQDAGENWALLNLPRVNLSEVTSILLDPADSSHYQAGLISADGGGLFDSRDAGQTWTVVGDIRDFGVRALAAAPSKPSRFVAGTTRGVMLSEDSGKTWTRISDAQNLEMQGITAVAIDPANPDIIYAGTSHLPWKTMDGGKSWESIHTGMIDDSDVFSIYVDPTRPSDVFASACSGIYSSDNGGDQWRKLMGIPNTSRRTHVIRKDPSGVDTIYAGTTTGLFKSLNLGGTWRTLTDTQVNFMAFDRSHAGSLYLAMEYEGIGKSSDGGDNLRFVNQGFVDRTISSVSRSGDKLLALETQLGETSGIFVSADHGENWAQMKNVRGLIGVHLKTIAGLPGEERILVAASPHAMYKSIDGGETWKPLPVHLLLPPPPEIEHKAAPARTATGHRRPVARKTIARKPVQKIREIYPSQIDALYSMKDGSKDLLFAATNLGLLASSDAGERWTLAEIPGASAVSALFSAPNADGRLIVRAASGLFASSDFGAHWTPLAFPLPPSDVNDIAIPADTATPLLAATRVGLYSSPDGGAQWYTNLAGIPHSTATSVLYSATKTGYAVEYGRLYETKDSGASWAMVPSALPSTRIRQLWMPDPSSDRLFGITTDLGILFRN